MVRRGRAEAPTLRRTRPARPFGQRAGGSEIIELPQDPGEVVHGGADGGVLGPVHGFGEGQGTLLSGGVGLRFAAAKFGG